MYQQTFEALKLWHQLVDYDELPIEYERYMPHDQAMIQRRLEMIRQSFR